MATTKIKFTTKNTKSINQLLKKVIHKTFLKNTMSQIGSTALLHFIKHDYKYITQNYRRSLNCMHR